MSVEDLEAGIRALEDDEVRARVADGDLVAAGDLDLTDEEQGLLAAFASDYPEVVGFDITTSLLNIGTVRPGDLSEVQGVTRNKAKTADKAQQAMLDYLRG